MDRKLRTKIMYSILTEIDQGNVDLESKYYNISDEEFFGIIGLLNDEGYIRNVVPISVFNISFKKYILQKCSITVKGMDFLKMNSSLKKGYNSFKELRSWLPF